MSARVLRVLVALLLSTTAVATTSVAPTRAGAMAVERLAGVDRFQTAAVISARHYAPGVPAAYVATGLGFPDALAGGPAAAVAGAPILLVTPGGIPSVTASELARLRPGRIVVLGGPGVVSDGVVAQLDAYDAGGGVERIGGADRFETAALVSARHFAPGTATAYVATGANFPDALVGGVAAARSASPVLLTTAAAVPPSTDAELRRLAPQRIVVLGGAGVVPDGIVAQLAAIAPVSRLAGATRYETGVAVSAASFGSPAAGLFVATGATFPDALVAVPAAAASGAALLLVPGSSVPGSVLAEAARLAPGRLVLLGGPAVVNDRVTYQLRQATGDLASLPACSYQDVLTPFRSLADWQRTQVDTILMVGPDYAPNDLADTSTAGLNGGHALRAHVIPDLAAMAAAARAAGAPIQMQSGYRDYATQQATFDYWVRVGGYEHALRTSARAGHSEHQLGITFDVTSAGGAAPWNYADWAATPAGAWMAANAWRYGFVMSYPRNAFATVCYDYEPWHYRYVGRDAAWRIWISGLTVREWLWLNGNGG
jgi:LAS superfamily LD-carboxypeptidase LdcB/putative cell wall-binding protein